MKNLILVLLLLVATTATAEVNVNINVNADIPVKVAPVRPLPGNAPPAVYAPSFVIQAPPDFLEPADLGFYVAIGVPYDLYYVGNTYYIFHNKVWYHSRSYNGPWDFVDYGQLPENLNQYRDNVERVRVIRDRDYKEYNRDQTRYRGRHFKPGKELKEKKKAEHEEWKERKKEDREEWKEEKRRDKEERKHKKHKDYGDD